MLSDWDVIKMLSDLDMTGMLSDWDVIRTLIGCGRDAV